MVVVVGVMIEVIVEGVIDSRGDGSCDSGGGSGKDGRRGAVRMMVVKRMVKAAEPRRGRGRKVDGS